MNQSLKLKLLLFFWRQHAYVLCLTIGILLAITRPTGAEALFFVFPFLLIRLALYFLLWYFYRVFNAKNFIFYQNLGLPTALLWGFTFGLDMGFTLLILSIF